MKIFLKVLPRVWWCLAGAGCVGVIEPDDAGADGAQEEIAAPDGGDDFGDLLGDGADRPFDSGGPCGGVTCGAGEVCFQDRCCQPSCSGKNCGDNGCGGSCGACQGADVCVDGRCQAPGSCAGVVCGERQWCKDGICRCQSGWVAQGAECVAPPASDPASRSAAEVCARWSADYAQRASSVWTPGPGACDPGTVDPESLDDGVRRLNLWRWLVGLDPVYHDPALAVYAQACAILIRANGQLNHSPPSDWTCYTAEGAAGAGHCNEAMGSYDPASAIDLYLWDPGVSSLGHRRWLLDPPMLPTGFGQAEGYNCTYVMTGGNATYPGFVAFPPPGPVPQEAVMSTWSVGAGGFDAAQTTLTVEDLNAGTQSAPVPQFPGGGYGSYAYLSFSPELPVQAGHDYRVTITQVRWGGNPAPAPLSYTVRVVACP